MHYKNGWARKIAKHHLAFSLLTITLLLSACAGSRIVQPLNKSQWQASMSFGGPLLKNKQDQTEITPLSSVSVAYGVKQSLTAFGSWNAGSYYLKDIYHFDAGFTHEIVQPFYVRPGITYSGIINTFTGKGGSKFYPQLDINSYWLFPNKDFIYVGMSNWFELSADKAHGQAQNDQWLNAFHLGYNKNIGAYSANLETKYIAPFATSEENVIEFVNIGNKGATGIYLSFSRKFK